MRCFTSLMRVWVQRVGLSPGPRPRELSNPAGVAALSGPKEDAVRRNLHVAPCSRRKRPTKRVVEVIKDITPRKQLEEARGGVAAETQGLLKTAIKEKAFLETIVNGI